MEMHNMRPFILYVLVLESRPLFCQLPSPSLDKNVRYSRYMQLAAATFREKMSKLLALFPIGYLSIGTCVTLVIIGGSCKTFYQIVCGPTCTSKSLTTVEWYMVFTSVIVILSQLPNLNFIAGVSLVAAITAVGCSTFIWTVSVSEGRIPGVAYNPVLTVLSSGQHCFDFKLLLSCII
ncbi:lysine histidine transporter-like 8 [Apium graveolens]|uniref:lysine histidine transporter-like 8 n=1 Tax=Apium graveolens TaxID=4045 RepID=UPI003D7A4A5B